jgi:CTP:phosphocholine cytidylyltransferase-like protein
MEYLEVRLLSLYFDKYRINNDGSGLTKIKHQTENSYQNAIGAWWSKNRIKSKWSQRLQYRNICDNTLGTVVNQVLSGIAGAVEVWIYH